MVSNGCPDRTTQVPPTPPAMNPFSGLASDIFAREWRTNQILCYINIYDATRLSETTFLKIYQL